ncbi:MAG: VOC family protein [bacterium]
MSKRRKALTPILICKDVQSSIKFYCDILGFEVEDRMDDVGKTGWAMLKNGEVQLMLGSPHYHPEPRKTDGKYPQAVYYFYPTG